MSVPFRSQRGCKLPWTRGRRRLASLTARSSAPSRPGVWGNGMSPKVLWDVVRTAAARAGIEKLAPHDLRRTCARLCHLAGGELDQIQFLLGHVSIQTTERYLGCKQRLRCAVNDRLGIEPTPHWVDQLQKRDHSPVGDYSRVTHNIGMVAFSRGNADAVFKVQHPGMATSRGMVCGIGSRSASSCFRLSWGR